MKKIAVILFTIFALVQAGPAVQTLINPDQVSLFIVDEEKNNNTKEDTLKEIKKDFSVQHLILSGPGIASSFHKNASETIYSSHSPENLTPPPNC